MSYTQRRRYQLFVYTMAVLLALPPGVFTSQVFANARTSTLSRESTMETFRNPQITRWNRFLGVDSPTEIAGGAGQALRYPSNLGNVGDMGMTPFGLWVTNEGRMEWAERDLSFPGVGLNLTFERVWRGSVTSYDGPLGGEWEFNWNSRLFEDSGTGDVTVYEMGRTETYTESGGSYSSPVGRYDTLSKDTGPNPDVFTRTDKYGLVETYEDEGSGWYRLVSIVDPNDNTLSFSYDGSSQLTTVTDSLSRDTTVIYDGSGRISTITDPASRVWTYTYDGNGDLTSVADPLSHATTYGYDASSRLTSVKQPQDSSPSLVVYYDSTTPIPQVTRQTHNGSDFFLEYDTTNRWVTIEDRAIANAETRYGYDTDGRIISREIWEDTVGGSAAETSWAYNSDHEVTLVTFDAGNRVAYTYDGSGNIVTLQLQQSSGDTTSPTEWVYTYTSLNRVSTLTDPNGRTWDYDYDGDGNLTQVNAPAVTVPSGIASADNNSNGTYDGTIVETYAYEPQGLLTRHTDAVGTVTDYTYTTVNSVDAYLHEVKRDVGTGGLTLVQTYAYNAAGNVTSTTDPEGNTTTHAVNDANLVTQTIEPLAITKSYSYDAGNRLTESSVDNDTDVGNGSYVVTHEYNGKNQLTRTIEDVTGAARLSTSFAYDANERMTKQTSPEGEDTVYSYGITGQRASVTRKATSAPDDAITVSTYNDNGLLTSTTDPNGNVTTLEYDLHDWMTRRTDPEGHYTTYEHDKAGNVTRVRQYNSGNTRLTETTTSFDEANRVYKSETVAKKADLSTNLGDGLQTRTMWRDEVGRVLQSSGDICGCSATSYVYDGVGRRVTLIDALTSDTNKVLSEYDKNGNVTKVTRVDDSQDTGIEANKSIVTESVYDARNRLVTRKDRLDVSNTADTVYSYGKRDQVTRIVNGAGDVQTIAYNEQLWRTTVTQETAGDDVITSYTYDDDGRVITYTATNSTTGNQATAYTYDALGRLVTTTWPDTGTSIVAYDKAGNRVSMTDPIGTLVVCSYDDRNLLTHKALTLATNVEGPTSVDFGYDGVGRMVSADTDEGGFTSEIDRTYNSLGRIETETQVIDGWNSGAGRTITYAWNEKGQKTGVTYPVSGDVITYTRDELDRVDQISRNGSEVVDYTFSGKRVIGKTFPGSVAQYTYDDAGRLSKILHKDSSSGNTLAEFDYGFDRAHRITHQDKVYYDDVQNTRILGDKRDEGDQYAYDGAGRLVTVLQGVPTAKISTAMATNITNTDYDDLVEYTYDQTGNRTTLAVDGTPTVTYTHDVVNEMVTENAASLSYDANGNFEGPSNARHYDFENRLASYDDGSHTYTWHYDALGRVVQRDRSGLNRHPRSYYDGEGIVDKIDYNSGSPSETLTNTYVYGDQIDELLLYVDVNADPDEEHYVHADHLGSVQLLVDGSGSIVESYRYDAWGVPTIVDDTFTKLGQGATSPAGNVYMYTGRSYAAQAAESGEDWYFYRARHYRADAGRFVQRDPLGYVDGAGWYGYVRGGPPGARDPRGTYTLLSGPDGGGCPGHGGGCRGFGPPPLEPEMDDDPPEPAQLCRVVAQTMSEGGDSNCPIINKSTQIAFTGGKCGPPAGVDIHLDTGKPGEDKDGEGEPCDIAPMKGGVPKTLSAHPLARSPKGEFGGNNPPEGGDNLSPASSIPYHFPQGMAAGQYEDVSVTWTGNGATKSATVRISCVCGERDGGTGDGRDD